MYPKNKLAQLVIAACENYGVKNVVISPGSRNASLIVVYSNHPGFNSLSVVDERSAAFFGLGIAQQSRQPVVVVCTSGSALLNYAPAVAEAFYSEIPLVVISADRPKNMIDIGDGQTIRQENVLSNHTLFNANLIEGDEQLAKNQSLLEEAFEAVLQKNGPIHINVPFSDPLYEFSDKLDVFNFKSLKPHNNSLIDEIPLNVDELQQFAEIWNQSDKKMVLLGEHFPNELIQTQLTHLIEDESVIVLTEASSNVTHEKFINCIDKLIFPFVNNDFNVLNPDILITFGGQIVSKKIKELLRKFQPKHHWHISKNNEQDTFFCLTHHFKISPELFFSQFFFLTKYVKSEYQRKWLLLKKEREQSHNKYLKNCDFSDLKSFETILQNIPPNTHVQFSNSAVIRYAQLFQLDPSLKIFCNRGTSGIDGSTSTAIGAAYINSNQTVLITGDISFFYDQTALWNKYIPTNFRIIIINNQGGGIFRFIPGPSSTNALDYFETPHNLTASYLCEMYRFEYQKVSNEIELKDCLKQFFEETDKPKVLEIMTPRTLNDVILKSYFKSL